jgi:DNA polymerase
LLHADVPPEAVEFVDAGDPQHSLFEASQLPVPTPNPLTGENSEGAKVPRKFLKLLEQAACHRDPRRWNALYQVLWRLSHGEPGLLEIVTDDTVYRLREWSQQVGRDVHKMKSFVRFRSCRRSGEEWFVAWYRPDHRIIRLVAPFFRDRFATMNWSILTAEESVFWDQTQLWFGPGTSREAAPRPEKLEQLWGAYYRSTFNPARIKLRAMRAQMPKRYWENLPETQLIDELVADAPRRVAEMMRATGAGE